MRTKSLIHVHTVALIFALTAGSFAQAQTNAKHIPTG